jgi:HAD superfamily hydrolase (TIGR01509 family)
MIKAVIFDCFGVLAREGFFPFLETYFKNDTFKRQLAIDSMKRMGAGLISHDDCILELSKLAGISFDAMRAILTDNPPDDQLFMFIEKILKPNYKVGILSNAGADRTIELFGNDRAVLFDDVLLSYQVGMIKPEAAIYELAAQRLGVLNEECIFIDDQPRYCEGAKDVGMETIQHESASKTIAAVEALIHA